MLKLGRWIAVLLLVGVLGACANDQEPESEPGAAATAAGTEGQEAPGAEAVGFGQALAQIRGHHLVALELYEAGDKKAAAVHAGHPIAEILDSVQSELNEYDPAVGERLASALDGAAKAVAQGKPAGEVEAAFEDADAAIDQAFTAVVGDQAEEASYKGSVIAALLSTSAHEYEEAVGPEGLRSLEEYQDGYAFLLESRRLYGEISSKVEAAAIEEAEEIEEAFETLEKALPSPTPPAKLPDPEDVEAAAELIGHELEETVGAAPLEESDPEEIVAEIEELLDEIVSTYEAGDADAAAELSAEAYLENYEVIEAEVIEYAQEVNEELEPLLGADLRKRISEGAPLSEIQDMIARAKELLAEALEAIEGH